MFFSFLSGREIFELDNYSPIPVENEAEYKLVVSRFPFHDAEIEKVCWAAFSDGHTEIYTGGVANDKTQNLNNCASRIGLCFCDILNVINALCLVLYYIATISKEAAHVPVSASDLHSGQGVHLCQFKVLRVTTSQVSALHVHDDRSSRSHPLICVILGKILQISLFIVIGLSTRSDDVHYIEGCSRTLWRTELVIEISNF